MHRAVLLLSVLVAAATAACQPAPGPAPSRSSAPDADAHPAVPALPALTGTSSGALAAPPAPLSPPVKINVANLGSGADLGFYVALEHGYFDDEGITLDLVDFASAALMTPPLATGQLDVGLGGVSASLFNSVAQGIPFKIVANKVVNAPDSRSSGWMVRTDLLDSGQVRSAADFRGLAVALGGTGTIADVELDKILQEGGLTLEDITIKQIAYPDQVVAFANKSIDAAYVFEPTRTRLLDQNTAKVWRNSGELYPNHESSVLIYGPSMAGKREAAQRFMVAYLRGVRELKERGIDRREPEIVDIAVKWTTIKEPALWQKMELQQGNPDGYNYRPSLAYDVAWFAAHGLLPTPPPLDDVLDQTYLDYAIGRLGRYRPGCGPNPCP